MKNPRVSSTDGLMVPLSLALALAERACISVSRAYHAALAICSRHPPYMQANSSVQEGTTKLQRCIEQKVEKLQPRR